MHLQKVSALVVHIGFTAASVIGGTVPEENEMGRRDWRDDRDAALQRAADAQARTNELAKQFRDRDTTFLTTPIVPAAQVDDDSQHEKRQFGGFGGFGHKNDDGNNKKQGWFGGNNNNNNKQGGGFGSFGGFGNSGKNSNNNNKQGGGQGGGWQAQKDAGIKAADDAKARANAIAEAYRKQFGQGGSQKRDLDTRQNAAAEAAAAAAVANASAAANAFGAANDPAAASANAAAAAAANANAAAASFAAMPNNQQDNNWQSVAASAQSLGQSYATQYAGADQTWASYGASMAASAESHASAVASAYNNGGDMPAGGDHGNQDGDWHATASEAVASAHSVAASYRSEYPAAPAPTYGENAGAAHGTGAGVYPSATHVVEVNGGVAGQARLVGATVVGAGMAFLAVAFGRL